MNFYIRHMFFCNNIRENGKACCSQKNAKAMYRYAKDKCRANGMLGYGKIGISESRCLGRCEQGPVAVVYPDNIWYTYTSKEDIDKIINEHLLGTKVVKNLQIND